MPKHTPTASTALLALALLAPSLHASTPATGQPPKVIVLGFDGIDPAVTQRFMDEGALPNLKKLAEKQGFVPLDTVFPSQSPVCWASMLNGTNPAKHGATGFVRREPGTYRPELGVIRIEQKELLWGHWGRFASALIVFAAVAALTYGVSRLLRKGVRAVVKSANPAAPNSAATSHAAPDVTRVTRAPERPHRRALISATIAGTLAAGFTLWAAYQVPFTVPQPRSARDGEAFFEQIAKANHKVAVLNTPMDWPVKQRPNVLEYAGFDVPDLRGTFGIYTYFTTGYHAGEEVKTEMGADVCRLRFEPATQAAWPESLPRERVTANGDVAIGKLYGVRNLMEAEANYPEVVVPLAFVKNADSKSLTVYFGDEAGVQAPVTIPLERWSDWVLLRFKLSPLVTINARLRFFMETLNPELSLYCTPLQMDPANPAGGHHIANPASFAQQIQDIAGHDHGDTGDNGIDTLGWPELTNPAYDENLRDQTFMDHLLRLERKRAAVLYDVLARREHSLVCGWFYGSDRVQHMMWRYMDPENPQYAGLQSSPLKDSIKDIYRFMDGVVGEVLAKHAGPDTLVLVCSDHGFAPFRRAVSINRWLRDKGYLVLKGDQAERHATDMFTHRDALLNEVDWGRTKAYAMGLGKIYLNVKGREPQGIVEKADVPALASKIAREFEQLTDPERGGAKVVSRVYLRDGDPSVGQKPISWGGKYLDEIAELLVGFMPGYRVSWQTTLGYAKEDIIFNNGKRWSGDHCSLDPALIPGVLFSNRPLATDRANLMDLAPTILSEFGLKPNDDVDGKLVPFAKPAAK